MIAHGIRAGGIPALLSLLLSTGHPLRLRFGQVPLRLTIAAYVLVVTAAPAVFVAFRLNGYADGGLFSFAILAGRSWDFVWANFSGRLAAYALTVRPAELYLAWTGDATGALRLYALLFGGLPCLGLLASLAFLPAGRRKELIWPAFAFLTAGLLTFGFPTETWLTLSAFWPLLFALRYAGGRVVEVLAVLLLAGVYVFSHEGMVLGLPVLFLELLRRGRAAETRPAALRLALTLLLVLLAWICTKAALAPTDPATARAIAGNQWDLVHPRHLYANLVLQKAGIAVLAGAALWGWLGRRDGWTARRSFLLAALLAMVLALALIPAWGLYASERYGARVVVLLLLPLLGLVSGFATIEAVPGASPNRAFDARLAGIGATPVLAPVLLLLSLHLGEGVKFLRQWQDFATDYETVTAGGPGPVGRPDLAVYPATEAATGAARARPTWQVDWGWALPYLAVVIAPDRDPQALTYLVSNRYHPVNCSQIRGLAGTRTGIGPQGVALLRDFLCSR